MSAEIIKSIMGHFDGGYPAGTHGRHPASPVAKDPPELGGWSDVAEAWDHLVQHDADTVDTIGQEFLEQHADDLVSMLSDGDEAHAAATLKSFQKLWAEHRDREVERLIEDGQLDCPPEQRGGPDDDDQT